MTSHEDRFVFVLVEQRPILAIGGAFQFPGPRIARRHVFRGSETVFARSRPVRARVALPHDGPAIVDDAPLRVLAPVSGELDFLVGRPGPMPAGAPKRRPARRVAEPQPQMAERLITAEGQVGAAGVTRALALAGEVGVDQLLRLDVPAFEEEPPGFRQGLVRVGPVGLVP
jgi:hypothetical protein